MYQRMNLGLFILFVLTAGEQTTCVHVGVSQLKHYLFKAWTGLWASVLELHALTLATRYYALILMCSCDIL